MEFFDAHVHFIWRGNFDDIVKKWYPLKEMGLKGMAFLIIVENPPDFEKCLDMIPTPYRNKIEERFFEEPFRTSIGPDYYKDFEVFPYVDTRFLTDQGIDLYKYRELGFRGLKVLYVPHEAPETGIVGWRKFYGRSEKDSRGLVIEMVKQAIDLKWPIIFHVNLKEHEDVIKEILEMCCGSPFIIPHFGFSRKKMMRLLEQYEFCYTDFSSLLPYMQKDSQSYLEFIKTYQDRILFASDASLGLPDMVLDYYGFITELVGDEKIREKILIKNYKDIHG